MIEPQITPEWINEQLALCAKTTPGPWVAAEYDDWVVEGPEPRQFIAVASAVFPEGSIGLDGDDAHFIAAAHANYPLLLKWALVALEPKP